MFNTAECPNTFCTCSLPWPAMLKLSAGQPNGYYVCRECGAVCEEVRRANGSAADQHWYTLDQPAGLPAAVVEQAQAALAQIEPDMVHVPAGAFVIGVSRTQLKTILADCYDSKPEWYRHEHPRHRLVLPAYAIARTPVTSAQYRAFVKASGYPPPPHWSDGRPPFGQDDHPVVGVSWHDSLAYCRWLAEVSGKPYRLPSEVEWEKAARGTDGRVYPWGNAFQAGCCNCAEGGFGTTTPVKAYDQGASPYGALDMSGNAWEWTGSLYMSYPYTTQDGREDPAGEGPRVLRGGAFCYNRYDVRCSARSRYQPDRSHPMIGFRPALSLG